MQLNVFHYIATVLTVQGTTLVLRETGLVDWSWTWVLSPIWIPYVLAIPVALMLIPAFRERNTRDAS